MVNHQSLFSKSVRDILFDGPRQHLEVPTEEEGSYPGDDERQVFSLNGVDQTASE